MHLKLEVTSLPVSLFASEIKASVSLQSLSPQPADVFPGSGECRTAWEPWEEGGPPAEGGGEAPHCVKVVGSFGATASLSL